jgi:hypothetical protein
MSAVITDQMEINNCLISKINGLKNVDILKIVQKQHKISCEYKTWLFQH